MENQCVMHGAEANSAQWHELRTQCILTASELPCLLNCGYDSPQKLFEYKTGRATKTFSAIGQEQLDRGRTLEPFAVRRLASHLGRTPEKGLLWTRHTDVGTLGGTPDCVFYDVYDTYKDVDGTWFDLPRLEGPKELGECKCPAQLDSVERGNRKHVNYAVQQLMQMFCSESARNHLIVYSANGASLYSVTHFTEEVWELCCMPPVRHFVDYLRVEQCPPRSFTKDHYDSNQRIVEYVSRCRFTRLLPWIPASAPGAQSAAELPILAGAGSQAVVAAQLVQ